MADFHSVHTTVRTRKPHRCEECGKRIELGSAAEYRRGVWEGDFYSYHLHPECSAAAQAFYDELCVPITDSWPWLVDGDFIASERDWICDRFPVVAERLGWTKEPANG